MHTVSPTSSVWQDARLQMMLDPDVVNLNTGSFGPLPKCVFERATELRMRLAQEPMAFLVREAGPLLWESRERLAAFLGTPPQRLVFASNVTSAINTVANFLRLPAPGEILLSDHEYGTMHWCWQRAAQKHGLTIKTFPLPIHPAAPDDIVTAVCSAITPRTRLLFFSHVYSPTGLIMPAEELCREARQRGILTVIDGAHAPAMIPLRLERMECDFYGGNCHKWLLAPTGSGFLYFGPGNEERLRPAQVSWGWHFDQRQGDERNAFGATHRIYQMEFEGTRDPCPWLGIDDAISFQEKLGWENIRARNRHLVAHLRKRMSETVDLPLWTPAHPNLHSFMTTYRLPEQCRAEILREQLWRARIELPVIERPDHLLIRVSTHFYNTTEEIDRFIGQLPTLLDVSSVT